MLFFKHNENIQNSTKLYLQQYQTQCTYNKTIQNCTNNNTKLNEDFTKQQKILFTTVHNTMNMLQNSTKLCKQQNTTQ